MSEEAWLSNVPDPYRMDRWLNPQWHEEDRWFAMYTTDKVVGPPKRTRWYSAERLSAMGFVGVYCR